MKYNNSKDALAAIMSRFGTDVLLGRLNAYFPDFASSFADIDKSLVYAVHERGAAQVLKNSLHSSRATKENAIREAVEILTYSYIEHNKAERIIGEFVDALGWGFDGSGEPPSDLETLIMSAERGDAYSQHRLGQHFYVEQNYEQAVYWLTESALQGNMAAQGDLGYCYELGRGVPIDYESAVYWYTKAAEQGHKEAQYTLGDSYYFGYIGVTQDYKAAVKWYTKAAEQGHKEAQYTLGGSYYFGYIGVTQDYKAAVKWYIKAAEQGYEVAQYMLGDCYYLGHGVTQDYKAAVEWYIKAAEQGYENAQSAMGNCYYFGNGVTRDYKVAVKWYTKAAEQGYEKAQSTLGDCYYYGQGVKQNRKKAVKWYRKAAKQYSSDSQFMLGECYFEGHGVVKDFDKAVNWYKKSAKHGNVLAKHNLSILGIRDRYDLHDYKLERSLCSLDAASQYKLGYVYSRECNRLQGSKLNETDRSQLEFYQERAFNILTEADKKGFNLAGYYLAVNHHIYANDSIRNSIKDKTIDWATEASKTGDLNALLLLGVLNDKGVEYEYEYEYDEDYYSGYNKWLKAKKECASVFWYLKAAEQGNVIAQSRLGDYYSDYLISFCDDRMDNDETWHQSNDEAIRWYTKAAEQGDAYSQRCLGKMFEMGSPCTCVHYCTCDVKPDNEKAIYWYTKAAEQGDFTAQNILCSYYINDFNNHDYKKALNWCTKIAEAGDNEYQVLLADFYVEGSIVDVSYEKTIYWYTRAAEQGNREAQVKLSKFYFDGLGVLQDYKKAVSILTKSLKPHELYRHYSFIQKNDTKSYLEKVFKRLSKESEDGTHWVYTPLGDFHCDGIGIDVDYHKAVYWYRKAAEHGDLSAHTRLGDCYRYGHGIPKDEEKAVSLYKKVAELGDAVAQIKLGDCYFHGHGISIDEEKAIHCYRKAADKGEVEALERLVNYYKVRQDYEQSVYWNTQHAEQGNTDAQLLLAHHYFYGVGLPQCYEKAAQNYTKAAIGDYYFDAKFMLGNCYFEGLGVLQDYKKAVAWYAKSLADEKTVENTAFYGRILRWRIYESDFDWDNYFSSLDYRLNQ